MPIKDYTIEVNGKVADIIQGKLRLDTTLPSFRIKVRHLGYKEFSHIFSKIPDTLTINLTPLTILLESVTVNTGYQKIERERITGSVESIGSEVINRSVSSNILNRLEDLTTSVSFDRRDYDFNNPKQTDGNLDIRGISSINSSNRPLIVLDNFPYEGNIENINPNDIESISILKDAAAASIWGARAGNGVIVITSKRGKTSEKTRINFTSNVTIGQRPELFKMKQAGSKAFINMEEVLFNAGFYDDQINDPTHPALSPTVELLRQFKEGEIQENELRSVLDALGNQDIRTDYQDHFYRPSFEQRYAIDLRGGSERTGFYTSIGFDKGNQSFRYNSNSRFTFSSALDHSFGNRVKLHTKVMYNNSRTSSSPNGYGVIALYPYADLVNGAGDALGVNYGYSSRYLAGVSERGLLDWTYRPLQELMNSKKSLGNNEFLADLGMDVKIGKGLSYHFSGQFSRSGGKEEDLNDLNSYMARNLINLFSEPTDQGFNYAVPMGSILDQAFYGSKRWAIRNQVSYDNRFGELHRLTGILGNEVRDATNIGEGSRMYGYDERTLISAPIDMVSWFPTFDNLQGIRNIGNYGFFREQRRDRFVSLYGNLAYTYADKYNLYASARKDASNLFGVGANNRWTPLWSIGASWDLDKEGFLHNDIVDKLKLRASYGYSGNVNNSVPALSTLALAPYLSAYGARPFAEISNPPNPSLRWERIGTINFGADFSLLDKRLSGTIDFYRKNSVDLIADSPVDPTVGIKRMMMNSANTSGTGIDLSLSAVLLRRSMEWRTNLLMSYNRVIVTKYNGEREPVMSSLQGIDPIEGQPAYAIFSYRWAGLDPMTGAPQGYLGNEISQDWRAILNETGLEGLVLHGSARPRWFGSFRNDLKVGGFSVSVNIAFRFQYFLRRPTIEYNRLGTWAPIHSDFLDRWQVPGDELHTQVPAFQYPNDTDRNNFFQGSEINVERGDNIRLKDIRIAYRLNRILPSFNNAEIFGLMTNLGFLWRANKRGLDPDTPLNGLGLPKTFSLGGTFSF